MAERGRLLARPLGLFIQPPGRATERTRPAA
jgi:hypothetical protein